MLGTVNKLDNLGIYHDSIQSLSRTLFMIAKSKQEKSLVLIGSEEFFVRFGGEESTIAGIPVKICPQNHVNCLEIRKLFEFTKPVSHGDRPFSFGMGDRLGLATPGHIRAIKNLDVFPILAQQSMRELNLTGRTYQSVLDDVSWAVFQEGYTGGFGADADHLKVKAHIISALQDGYTMITLDCSEHIDNHCFQLTSEELAANYQRLPEELRISYENHFLNKSFNVENHQIQFNQQTLMQCVLVYRKTLDFITEIYFDVITKRPEKIDFEVSIDETTVPTTPEAHFFIASELQSRHVCVSSMAPRFCGEFQKGIDYIGCPAQFEKEYIVHAQIARHFNYRISVHSGSDKFSVFPCVGRHSGHELHVKTAGTSWLEAVRMIAAKNPELYRRLHQFALERLSEAQKYYHIGAKPENIADIDKLTDDDLPALMDQNDARQVLHITYGLILQEKDANGKNLYKDDIYKTINQHEDDYYAYLINHMGNHFKTLFR